LRARVLEARVACASHAGDLEGLLTLVLAARVNAERAGDARAVIVQTVNAGFAAMQLGEYEDALRTFERARVESERLGLVSNRRSALQNAGYVLLCLGRIDEAREAEQEVLREIGSDASPRLVTLAHACLALIELSAGDLERASEHAVAAASAATGKPQAAYAELALAEVTLARGDSASALERADRALAIMKEVGRNHFAEGRALLVRALALRAMNENEAAVDAIERAAERVRVRARPMSERRRAVFQSAVAENRRALELAAEWARR